MADGFDIDGLVEDNVSYLYNQIQILPRKFQILFDEFKQETMITVQKKLEELRSATTSDMNDQASLISDIRLTTQQSLNRAQINLQNFQSQNKDVRERLGYIGVVIK